MTLYVGFNFPADVLGERVGFVKVRAGLLLALAEPELIDHEQK
jgi:hypothetical protein